MLPLAFAALAAAGTAFSVFGKISEANARSEAAEREAELKRRQARELLLRQSINESIMREEAVRSGLSLASRNSRGESGGGIGSLLTVKKETEQNILLSRREAEYQAEMIRRGADVNMKLAGDIKTASYIGAAGTLLSSAGDIYMNQNKYGKPGGTSESLWKTGQAKDPFKNNYSLGVDYDVRGKYSLGTR